MTSVNEVVTKMRDVGPAEGSSFSSGARNPSVSRFFSGVLLCCSARVTQWWLVMTRPCSETNDAEQPPRLTTALSGNAVGSASASGSKPTPSWRSVSACALI